MKKIKGIGGIFFRCADVQKTKDWYSKHLGLNVDDYGCTFWQEPLNDGEKSSQQWSPFAEKSSYFSNMEQQFMINYKVHDLEALLNELDNSGVEIVGKIEKYEYGHFGWIMDCDGRKVELWQPMNESVFENQ
ncbi:MAG: VOC family protein [Nonlabens sp.]